MITYSPIANIEASWLEFSQESRGWLDESKYILDQLEPGSNRASEPLTPPFEDIMWSIGEDGTLTKRKDRGIFAPSFMISPPPINNSSVFENIDLFSNMNYKSVTLAAVKLKDAVFSRFDKYFAETVDGILGEAQHETLHTANHDICRVGRLSHPHSIAAQPIYSSLSRETKVVGYLFSVVAWENFLVNLLPDGVNGIFAVLRNSCDQTVTYELNGNEVRFFWKNYRKTFTVLTSFLFNCHTISIKQACYVGVGDLHDATFNLYRRTIDFAENYFDPNMTSTVEGHCQIFLDVYPSGTYVSPYESSIPVIFTVIVASLFLIMAMFFIVYNGYVLLQ
jgi:hypothetical protein